LQVRRSSGLDYKQNSSAAFAATTCRSTHSSAWIVLSSCSPTSAADLGVLRAEFTAAFGLAAADADSGAVVRALQADAQEAAVTAAEEQLRVLRQALAKMVGSSRASTCPFCAVGVRWRGAPSSSEFIGCR